MKRAIAFALALAPALAHADPALQQFDVPGKNSVGADPCVHIDGGMREIIANQDDWQASAPGSFNGIATPCRYWQTTSDLSFDTHRVLTQRDELARAFSIRAHLAAVARVSFGFASLTNQSFYTVQGPLFSLGVRARSRNANYWVEFGLRFVPNWPGPNDTDPRTQQLALAATLSSGIADDAAWLPLSDFGWQLYGAFESRTPPLLAHGTIAYMGATWGGKASITPMNVTTWLGPQSGFIGNVYVDAFVGLPLLLGVPLNMQLGLHGELSLSTIWPGTELFPALGNVYVGWAPKTWFQMRIFGGPGAALTDTKNANMHYGARLEFFLN
jgi:hypothetical protein